MASSDADNVKSWWNKKFQATTVPNTEFSKAFTEEFKGSASDVTLDRIARFVVDSTSTYVSLDSFTKFVSRFGPFADSAKNCAVNLFDSDDHLHPWYHGAMERKDAQSLLKRQGKYILRLSSNPSKLSLSVCKLKEKSLKIKNVLVSFYGGKVVVDDTKAKNAKSSATLAAFFKANHDVYALPVKSDLYSKIQSESMSKGDNAAYGSITGVAGDDAGGSAYGAITGLGGGDAGGGAYGAVTGLGGDDAGGGAYGAVTGSDDLGGGYGAVTDEAKPNEYDEFSFQQDLGTALDAIANNLKGPGNSEYEEFVAKK